MLINPVDLIRKPNTRTLSIGGAKSALGAAILQLYTYTVMQLHRQNKNAHSGDIVTQFYASAGLSWVSLAVFAMCAKTLPYCLFPTTVPIFHSFKFNTRTLPWVSL